MHTSRNVLIPVILICGVVLGDHHGGNSAEAQIRSLSQQQNRAAGPVFKFRGRNAPQTASPQNAPVTRSASSVAGAWPGPRYTPRTTQYTAKNRFSTNAGQIQQTSAGDAFPLTGPVMHGMHRKRIQDYSYIYIEPPVPPEIKLHDIVTIIVDEKSEVIMNSKFNRQRTSKLKAELKEFIRLGNTGNLANAAANAPTIDAQLQGTLNSTGQLTDQEGIKYRIAATVVDVLPNGVLQLEARKKIQTQDDISEYTLTGELRASDVAPDNTASSENIASLNIVKNQTGRIYDSTKRNWGYRLYDLLSPF